LWGPPELWPRPEPGQSRVLYASHTSRKRDRASVGDEIFSFRVVQTVKGNKYGLKRDADQVRENGRERTIIQGHRMDNNAGPENPSRPRARLTDLMQPANSSADIERDLRADTCTRPGR
jgi:hypothetical protein